MPRTQAIGHCYNRFFLRVMATDLRPNLALRLSTPSAC